MENQILSRINSEEVRSLIRELVRIPTQNPPGIEKLGAEFIVGKLRQWGIQAVLIPEPYKNRPQAWGQVAGSDQRPVLVLNGHIDLVSEGNTTQ